jgi:hypothetical protein
MITDQRRKLAEYTQSETDLLPHISPLKYSPSVTSSGSKANLGDYF